MNRRDLNDCADAYRSVTNLLKLYRLSVQADAASENNLRAATIAAVEARLALEEVLRSFGPAGEHVIYRFRGDLHLLN